MITTPAPAPIYTDFQSLNRLKGAAREQSPEALQEIARQFEALFVQMMLKRMREAGLGEGGLLDSEQTRFYRGLFDQQLSLSLAGDGSLGIADMIVRQLGSEVTSPRPQSVPGMIDPLAALRQVERIRSRGALPKADITEPPAPVSAIPFKPTSPEAFVRQVWSPAHGAARRLGVAPEVLVAQAALETGWGKSVPRFADGRSSHNLFGIKADRRWQGERVSNSTLEFEAGLPVRRHEAFRAYDSYADSFADYANFIRSNPRYSEALRQAGDNMAYLSALQRAGYATDPDYAGKIEGILKGTTFSEAFGELKTAVGRPILSQEG